jgi:hypothetical protein
VALRGQFEEARKRPRPSAGGESLAGQLLRLGLTGEDLFNLSNVHYEQTLEAERVADNLTALLRHRVGLGAGRVGLAELQDRLL